MLLQHKNRILVPFHWCPRYPLKFLRRFPPSLSAKHEEELRKRAISKEFALASGVWTAADNELRELNFQALLPHEERKEGLQGICFPYVDLELKVEASWRIKPDTSFTLSDGSHPKYLSRVGDKVRDIAKVRRRMPHDLRHSWASHMLTGGADLAYVSAQLGHANPSITLRIYSHWVPGTRRVTTSILDTKSANTPEIKSNPL